MRWWRPTPGEPELLDWWRPLIRLARRAHDEGYHWAVHLDDFRLVGRVRRQGRPDVWVYGCLATGGELLLDDDGGTYRFLPSSRPDRVGQLRPGPMFSALWRAGVPYAVQPDLATS